MSTKTTIQMAIGVIVTFAGLVLLFIGVFVHPQGEIHSSVLIAFGEACTFAGALIGIDYHYRYRFQQFSERLRRGEKEKKEDEQGSDIG